MDASSVQLHQGAAALAHSEPALRAEFRLSQVTLDSASGDFSFRPEPQHTQATAVLFRFVLLALSEAGCGC